MHRLAILALLLSSLPAMAQDFPKGQLVEKVVTKGNETQSYALYLPTAYTPDRQWPILYVFDARSNGVAAAQRFVAGAERYGFLLASSNNTASDGPAEPNVTAIRAMWPDTHSRFAIDPRRVYAAGFSGTVRFACQRALAAPGTIEGVVAAGAGFPFEHPRPAKDNPFLYYGTVGDRDFNYYEVLDLADAMAELGLPHRVEVFAGPHQWMSEELATRALAWLELQAMKKGLRAKDAALIKSLWTDDLARAKALESTDLPEAHRLYESIAEDYRGLVDAEALNDLAVQVSRIAASEAFKKERKARHERETRDKEYLAAAPRALSTTDLNQAVKDLRIQELKKEMQSTDPAESLAAKRLLNALMGQTAFYLPGMFTEQGKHDRAAFVLTVATEIAPDNPEIWYELAAAHARNGAKRKALDNLRKAVEKGFKDRPRLEGEAAFANLRQDKGYKEIVAGIGS
jgi:tetratricopeptide (TPR) repeat protein